LKTSKIRIIGGALKGNHISFPSSSKLRPTSNKLREILFNWLNFEIEGLKCADCFSGSGALGIEAISRGAKSVTFIEKTPKFAASIKANLERLNISERCKIEIKNGFLSG
jgi:N6-adenine-specific methylase